MKRKLPADSFDFYVQLGLGRSYQAVASRYGVSKVTVTNLAKRDRWQQQLAELETTRRRSSKEKNLESLEEVHARHLKAARVVQAKALETLMQKPLDSGMDAVRALDLALRQERLLIGEPTDRSVVSVEQLIKDEYARVMRPAGEDEWGDGTPTDGSST